MNDTNNSTWWNKLKSSLNSTRKSIFSKLDSLIDTFKGIDDKLFDELEEILIMADVGVDTTMKICDRIREIAKQAGNAVKEPQWLSNTLHDVILEMFSQTKRELAISNTPPTVMLFVGVNGVGKTTSIGKLAYKFSKEGKKVILAAADTFRAAAVEQLEIWSQRVGCDLVKGQSGADPASVVYDALQAADRRKADYILIDTAGRLHTKKNLMDEVSKISRVISRHKSDAPNEILLVLDASTGQNGLSQAREFTSAINVTGIILTKLDGTAKGGVTIAVGTELNISVKLIGIGEKIEDLTEFDPKAFTDALFDKEQ